MHPMGPAELGSGSCCLVSQLFKDILIGCHDGESRATLLRVPEGSVPNSVDLPSPCRHMQRTR